MLQDLRFALRMIGSHRWFSAAVIVTIALGIGINTTVFTLVNAVLLKPVPIPGGERLVTVDNIDAHRADRWSTISWPDFQEFRRSSHSFEAIEVASRNQITLSEPGIPPERYRLANVSPGLFDMLRTPPVLGRGFLPSDGKPGAEPVVLIGDTLWRNRYASAADVIGRVVHVEGKAATIVGVMAPGMKFPDNEDLWMPIIPDAQWENRANHWLQGFAIRKADVSVDQANADIALIAHRLAVQFPDTNKDRAGCVMTFHDTYNGNQIRLVFLTMLGAVGFVLLIACANVANMMFSRALARSREISVRAALGASRSRLIRLLLVESVVLSCLGGMLGLGLSALGVHAFDLATQDVGKPYWIIFSMDKVAFGYFAAISVLSGVAFGLMPALRASRVDLNTALKDGAASGGGRRGGRLTAALVVLQFALTVVLLAGAGLMVRSFFAQQELNSFVQPTSLFSVRLMLPEGKDERYHEPESRRQFLEKLLPKVAALPGVTKVAATTDLPGLGSQWRDIEIEGHPVTDRKQAPHAGMVVQTPNYLSAIGLPLFAGRGFDDMDGAPGKEAAVVTQDFAAHFWPNESAVGHHFRVLNDDKPGPWMTVIGVCANIVQDARRTEDRPIYFISHRQEPWGWVALLVRTSSDPNQLASPIRHLVQTMDGELPLTDVWTLTAAMKRDQWALEVFGTLFVTFALTGLLMASVGIYAVVAQNTVRRTREIGIRMALGATRRHILTVVLARGVGQLLIGLVLGLAGAFASTRLLANVGFLGGVSAHDPWVFAGITLLLLAIGIFACWLPARRAAAIAPLEALRTE
ncbi:MAG TPA: ABC transporter permease [Candidatus Didemnitutus sp.]|nr:ABC transporter permease [Candidatus Didemnitutus sp.]